MVTKPTINLNCTSPKELLDEQLLAIHALPVAISTLAIAAPNARDYQTAPTGAFAQAQFERSAGTRSSNTGAASINELEGIAEYISDQC